jgi:hypothetical protein
MYKRNGISIVNDLILFDESVLKINYSLFIYYGDLSI